MCSARKMSAEQGIFDGQVCPDGFAPFGMLLEDTSQAISQTVLLPKAKYTNDP